MSCPATERSREQNRGEDSAKVGAVRVTVMEEEEVEGVEAKELVLLVAVVVMMEKPTKTV